MKRIWPIRLIQFSPLMILALILAVWFMTPPDMRTLAFEYASMRATPEMETAGVDFTFDLELEAVRRLQGASDKTIHITPGNSADGQLQTMATGVTGRVMSEAWRLYDTSGDIKPNAIAANSAIFETLRAYEERTHSRVAVFVLPPQDKPRVALQAIESTEVLTPAERRELENEGTLESLRRLTRGDKVQRLPVDIERLTSGSGDQHGDRVVYYTAKSIGGRIYEVYAVFPKPEEGTGDLPELPDSRSVNARANRRALDRLVRRWGGAAFVVGPTDDALVPLRVPEALDASNIAHGAQSIHRRLGPDGSNGVVKLAGEYTGSLDGAKWMGVALGVSPGYDAPGEKKGTVVARQPLVFVAAYDSSPDVPLAWEQIGKTPWHIVQVWMSARIFWIAGFLGVAFLASLIASPVAFAYERRQTAELELARERERVRRQARERVINRLTELSERVDRAAATASTGTRTEVQAVADDIDSTVNELRAILSGLSDEEGHRG